VRPSDVAFGPRQANGPTAVPAQPQETEEERAKRVAEREAREAALSPEERAERDKAREARRRMLDNIDTTGKYVAAVRDWVSKGADSQYVLGPDEVIERSRPRPVEFGLAAAHFELAQHLHRSGHGRDAVVHFKEAHRLDPANWSYLRQAMAIADPSWVDDYGYDMMSEIAQVGADTFYLPLEL
jgi:hypothetical protein